MFKKAIVGDRVWCMTSGWGTVHHVAPDAIYPIHVEWDAKPSYQSEFTFEGRLETFELYPSLFWQEQTVVHSPRPKIKVKKTVDAWINIYLRNTPIIGGEFIGNLHSSEREANRSANLSERIGQAYHIVHTYEVEE